MKAIFKYKHCCLWRFLIGAIMSVIATATAMAQEISPDSIRKNPDAWIAFSAPVQAMFANWPGVTALSGLGRVELAAKAVARKVVLIRSIHSENLRIGKVEAGTLDLQAWKAAGAEASEIKASLKGALMDAQAEIIAVVSADQKTGVLSLEAGPLSGKIKMLGLDLSVLSQIIPTLALAGRADIDIDLTGTTENPAGNISVAITDLAVRGEKIGAASLKISHENKISTIKAFIGENARPLITFTLALPLDIDVRKGDITWRDTGNNSFDLAASGLTPAKLKPFWRAPAGAGFKFDFTVKGGGTLDNLIIDAALNGTWSGPAGKQIPVAGSMKILSASQTASFTLGSGMASFEVKTEIPLVRIRREGLSAASALLDAALSLELPLPVAAPFFSGMLDRPDGSIQGSIHVSGTLGSPVFSGSLKTENSSATFLPLNRRIDPFEMAVVASGDKFTIKALSGKTGPGTFSGKGSATFTGTSPGTAPSASLWSAWRASLDLDLNLVSFPMVQEELPVALFNAVISARINSGPGDNEIYLKINKADISLLKESLPRVKAIPSNPAVSVFDWLNRREQAGFLAGNGRLRLDVQLIDPAPVQGNGYKLTIGGRMVLERVDDIVRVENGIEIFPGSRFPLFNNAFEIKGGLLTIAQGNLLRQAEQKDVGAPADPDQAPEADALEPVMDIVARGIVRGVHVLVKVQGPARKPQLVMVSVPSLPEYQILTLLIMGKVDAVDDRNGEVRREAAALVERFHNPSLKKQLFDRLGLDNLGFGFGSSVSEPIITVGKQVSRELYVETVYHVNAPPDVNERQGHVEYSLDPQWTLDTVFGDAGEGSFGVFWSTSFGGPAPPPPPDDNWGMQRFKPGDSDGDGVTDPFDLCRFKKEDMDSFEDSDGCPDPDNDHDGIPDVIDVAMNEPEVYNGFEDDDGKPDSAPLKLQGIIAGIRPLIFPPGSNLIDAEGRQILKAMAAAIAGFPELRIMVTGHSDGTGSEAANIRISLNRARAVAAVLVSSGIAAKRIDTSGAGSSKLLTTDPSPEAQAKNRRVEFTPISMPVEVAKQ
jgi:outer membrane protein OmpA-like peptidoglycan-associated protein